jgi:hypothetical protein
MGNRLHETEGREILAPSGTESEKTMGKLVVLYKENTRKKSFS